MAGWHLAVSAKTIRVLGNQGRLGYTFLRPMISFSSVTADSVEVVTMNGIILIFKRRQFSHSIYFCMSMKYIHSEDLVFPEKTYRVRVAVFPAPEQEKQSFLWFHTGNPQDEVTIQVAMAGMG